MISYRWDALGTYAAKAMITYYLELVLHVLNPPLYTDVFLVSFTTSD